MNAPTWLLWAVAAVLAAASWWARRHLDEGSPIDRHFARFYWALMLAFLGAVLYELLLRAVVY